MEIRLRRPNTPHFVSQLAISVIWLLCLLFPLSVARGSCQHEFPAYDTVFLPTDHTELSPPDVWLVPPFEGVLARYSFSGRSHAGEPVAVHLSITDAGLMVLSIGTYDDPDCDPIRLSTKRRRLSNAAFGEILRDVRVLANVEAELIYNGVTCQAYTLRYQRTGGLSVARDFDHSTGIFGRGPEQLSLDRFCSATYIELADYARRLVRELSAKLRILGAQSIRRLEGVQ